MIQTKRKTNVIALAIVMSLVFVFGIVAVLFATPATETAYAIDDVAQFHFYGLSNYGGSKTDGGITFSYSGNYYIPGGTSCIVLEAGGSFTVTVSNSALNNKNITKVKYTLTQDYASGAGEGSISVRLKRGTASKSTSMQTSSNGVSISGSGDLTLTITNNSSSDRSKAYRFGTNFTLMAPSQVAVTVSAGTGVKEVFLSSAQNGSPSATSGSKFAENSTVYAFAKLAKGYQSKNSWVLVSGNPNSEDAVYRTGSKTISTSNKDFGTIAADIKTKSLVLNGNGTENGTNINLTYGQTASVGVLSRSGYNFLGWNTNAEGTGETYGNSDGASLSVEQVNAILDDGSITAFYAMWKADINTVIAYINAIGEVEYTQACKDKIDEARALYDSLDSEDKAQVTNYGILTDAEATYNAMHADKLALDGYKTEKKAAADGLALDGDSAACEDLIADAKNTIDAVVYDCTKTLDQNKALVDAIVSDLANALTLQRDKEAFEVYKTPKKADADSLANPGDSDACGTLITNAKQAIDDIVYDCTKTLAKNKEMVDDIISALESDLYNQRQADGVAEYIDAISDPVTLASKPDINTARALYNGLSDNQKSLVSNYDKLTDAEAAYAVVELIDVIEAPITSEDEEAINTARNAFNALTNEQQALVGNIDDLLDAEEALAVAKLIEAIEAPITQEDEEAIEAARNAYDDLDEDQQDLVGNYDDLTDAEAALAVAKLIDAIDEAITAEDEETIEAAREAFDALTDGQKVLVGNINDLTDAEAALAVAKLIEAIEAPITQEDEEAIEAAREAFDALTEDQQDLVGNIDDLLDVEVTYVEVLIEEISDPVTLNDKEAIEAAREAFDALTEEQQALVDNVDKLIAAEVEYVKLLIEAIGEVEDTQSSKNAIDAAREAYDALTDDQKALITEDAPTIVTAEATYTTLHANNLAAAEVVALINAIGTVEYTETSKDKIDAAKVAYNGLTDAQKAIVDNYLTENVVDTIVVSETIYIGLGNQQRAQEVKDLIVAIGEVKYPDSKDKIEAAREGYDELTDAQKPLVDNYETLTTAEATYAELEAKANKKLSSGAIAGIVIGCVFGALLLALIILFLLYKRDKDKEDDKKLIKVPFINDVMSKIDAFIGNIVNIITKKKAVPAEGQKVEEPKKEGSTSDFEEPKE